MQPMRGAARNVHELILELRKPTIAAINGYAIGGGFEIALACDLRIAADHVYFALPEARVGMGANFASVLLPRLLPRAIAMELLFTGRRFDVDEAQRAGLLNRVVPGAALDDTVRELAQTIAANAPLTIRRIKETATRSQGCRWPPRCGSTSAPTSMRAKTGSRAPARSSRNASRCSRDAGSDAARRQSARNRSQNAGAQKHGTETPSCNGKHSWSACACYAPHRRTRRRSRCTGSSTATSNSIASAACRACGKAAAARRRAGSG